MGYEITGHTKLICLLGSPVGHSKSPMMHNEAFRALGLDYCYLAFDVGKEGLLQAVEGLKALGARGMNLTMPCKNAVVSLCDRLSPAARLCGAVNTVVIEEDKTMTGYTTDGAGFFFVLPGGRFFRLGEEGSDLRLRRCGDGHLRPGSFGRGGGNRHFHQEHQRFCRENPPSGRKA